MSDKDKGFPAISVKQLWANFIIAGIKPVDNRSRPTKFRGTILIHASKTIDLGPDQVTPAEWRKLIKAGICKRAGEYIFTRGSIIGMVDIVDCVTSHKSEFFSGPYGWVLKNPVIFENPIEVKGRVGIFYVPKSLLKKSPAAKAIPGSSQ